MLGGMVGGVAGGVLSAAGYGLGRAWDALTDQPIDANLLEDATHTPDIREGMDSRVTSRFGRRSLTKAKFHYGTDYAAEVGTPIELQAGGQINQVNFGAAYENHHWGNHIIVDHGNGLQTIHAHMSESFVRVGDRVMRGDILGLSGRSGAYIDGVTGLLTKVDPHYHYAIKTTGFNAHTKGFANPQSFDWYWHQKYGVTYFPKMW